jgi:hypothetical protein
MYILVKFLLLKISLVGLVFLQGQLANMLVFHLISMDNCYFAQFLQVPFLL